MFSSILSSICSNFVGIPFVGSFIADICGTFVSILSGLGL